MSQPIIGQIIDLEDKEYIEFVSFEPPTFSVTANYDETEIRGRTQPYSFYTTTSQEIWPFNIHLISSIANKDKRTPKDVWMDHLFLKSFAFADYGEEKYVKPPRLAQIIWGMAINLRGIIKNQNFTWVLPFDESGFPFGIDVTFDLAVEREIPVGYYEVRRGL